MNILVFRSAKMNVIDKLFIKLLNNNSDSITCLVQQNNYNQMKELYPKIKFISIHNDYFDYKDFKEKIDLSKKKYDEIIVPSSGKSFNDFDDIFKICDEIKCKRIVLFDCDGNEIVENCNFIYELKNIIESIFIKIEILYIKKNYKKLFRKI